MSMSPSLARETDFRELSHRNGPQSLSCFEPVFRGIVWLPLESAIKLRDRVIALFRINATQDRVYLLFEPVIPLFRLW